MGITPVRGSTRCLVLKPDGNAVFNFYVGGMMSGNCPKLARLWAFTGTWRRDNDWLASLMFCFKPVHLYQERMICRLIVAFHGPSLVHIDLVNDDMSSQHDQLGVDKTATNEELKTAHDKILNEQWDTAWQSCGGVSGKELNGWERSETSEKATAAYNLLERLVNRQFPSRATMTVAPAILREKSTKTRFLGLTRCSSFQHELCNCLEVVKWTESPESNYPGDAI